MFFFVLCTLCWQFLWEDSYLRYLCLFTIHILCFCFVPFSSSCVPHICWQFLWEGSYLRYLCLFTINILCFCFVFLRLVYPMLAVSLGRLLFTLFVFVYYKRIVFLFCFSSSCVPYVGSFSGRLLFTLFVFFYYTHIVFLFCFSSSCVPYVASSLGGLLFTLFVFVYYTHIVFLFCFSSSCVPYVGSFSGKALIYVICVCLLYTYCVFVLFFFVLCTLCWQFPWEGSYLRYLCLFTIHILCFCFVFLRLVYPMLTVSLGGLLFTLFVFVYNTHIVFLFCFSSSCWLFLWEDSYLRYLCLFTVHICVFVLFFFVLCTLC